MPAKDPSRPSATPSKEERLAKALRENLARRKALQRTKRTKDDDAPAPGSPPDSTNSNDKATS